VSGDSSDKSVSGDSSDKTVSGGESGVSGDSSDETVGGDSSDETVGGDSTDSDGRGSDGTDSDGGGGVGDVGNTDSLGHGNGLDVGVGPLLNHWGLDDVLDVVDWVWLLNTDWDGDIDLVWLGDVLVDDDGPLNGDGDWDGHIDLVLVDVQLGNDLGPLWGDDGVGASQTEDGLVDDGVSGGRAQVPGWWGDGSIGGWHWGSGDWDGHGVDRVGGWALDHLVGSWLVDGGTGNVVLVSDLDGAGTGLDGAVSDDAVLDVGLGDSGSGVHVLLDVGGSSGEGGVSSDDGGSGGTDDSTSDNGSSDGTSPGGDWS